MSLLNDIYALLPDNTDREISEQDLRDSFSKTFQEMSDNYYKKVSSQYFNSNYVLLADGTPKAAGDLGKNVANSPLISIVGAGLTLGANWAINTSGFYYSITGLSDVSSDSTFNTILAQNSAGRLGKTNGKQSFLALPSILSEIEKSTWKTTMNGGWTTNSMNVFMINPIIMKNLNHDQYITLLGTNLNLNPASFQVQIVTESSDPVNYTVIKTIDNSKVQLYPDGLTLVFTENFHLYNLGKYKVRLWNGVASYMTSVSFEIVANLVSYNLNNLTWDVTTIRNETPTAGAIQTDSSGAYVACSYSNMQQDWAASNVLGMCISSSAIGNMADDFYIEMSCYPDSAIYRKSTGGISNESSPVLANNLIASQLMAVDSGAYASPNDRLIILKRGSFMTTILKTSSNTNFAVQTVTTDSNVPVKFKLCLISGDIHTAKQNLIIRAAYKLN